MNTDLPISVSPVRRRRRLYEATPNDSRDKKNAETAQKKSTPVTPLPEPPSAHETQAEPAAPMETQSAAQASPATLSPRRQEAENIVRDHSWWSMTFGLIPVPLLDVVAITGVQLKMIQRLCDYYQQSFSEQQARAIIAALLGGSNAGFVSAGVSRSLGKFIPFIGFVVTPIAAGALTYGIGRVFVHHFELGGTFLSFDVEQMREHFARERAGRSNEKTRS